MLTVKVVASDGGESVLEATSVFMNTLEQSKLMPSRVYYFVPGESNCREVVAGDVYVMNEHGKTVANYHLYPPRDEVEFVKPSSNIDVSVKDK